MSESEHHSHDKYGGGGRRGGHMSMDDDMGNRAATLVMGADMIHLQSAQPTNDVDRASRIEVHTAHATHTAHAMSYDVHMMHTRH